MLRGFVVMPLKPKRWNLQIVQPKTPQGMLLMRTQRLRLVKRVTHQVILIQRKVCLCTSYQNPIASGLMQHALEQPFGSVEARQGAGKHVFASPL